MNELLDRMQRCAEAHFPEMAASLNPGASEAQIDAFERRIGFALPLPVRALYRWHDGQSSADERYVLGLFFGLPFLSLQDVVEHWKYASQFLDDMTPDQAAAAAVGYRCLPPGTIRQCAASKAWLPIADDGGGAWLGIDLDPDVAGSAGQVISFGGREVTRVQAAPGIAQFLERLLGMYEQGQYELVEQGEDEFSLSTVSPSMDHFLDYLRVKAEAEHAAAVAAG